MSLWVEQARADCSYRQTGLATAETLELSLLRKERRELHIERELLKNRPTGSAQFSQQWRDSDFLTRKQSD